MPDSVIAEDFEQARFNMIEQQIRPWDVLDQRVLDVIAELPREDFVPQRYRSTLAFSDISIPIGHEQYMLAPKLQARILQSLGIRAGERVLEVGCGNGYLTACLAKLGGETVGVDIFQDFVDQTQGRLDKLGLDHARCQLRDAARGWDEKDRFDAIAVTGSLPKKHEGFHTSLSMGVVCSWSPARHR